MSNESILQFWNMHTYTLTLESGDKVPVIDEDDFNKAMQSYSDQNLTEYKRRLKVKLLESWKSDNDFTITALHFIEDLIDSLDLNKKP